MMTMIMLNMTKNRQVKTVIEGVISATIGKASGSAFKAAGMDRIGDSIIETSEDAIEAATIVMNEMPIIGRLGGFAIEKTSVICQNAGEQVGLSFNKVWGNDNSKMLISPSSILLKQQNVVNLSPVEQKHSDTINPNNKEN